MDDGVERKRDEVESASGEQPPLVPGDGARSRPHNELLAWLVEGHRRWLASVRALAGELTPRYRFDPQDERDELLSRGAVLMLIQALVQ